MPETIEPKSVRLHVNIDHVATVREARFGSVTMDLAPAVADAPAATACSPASTS